MHNSQGASLILLRYVQPPLIVRGGGFGGCAEVGGVKLKLLNSLQNPSVDYTDSVTLRLGHAAVLTGFMGQTKKIF